MPSDAVWLGVLGLLGGWLTSRTGYVGHLTARVKDLEAGWNLMREAAEADALTKRAQGDHIDKLEAHIWSELPPPPPPRPEGV